MPTHTYTLMHIHIYTTSQIHTHVHTHTHTRSLWGDELAWCENHFIFYVDNITLGILNTTFVSNASQKSENEQLWKGCFTWKGPRKPGMGPAKWLSRFKCWDNLSLIPGAHSRIALWPPHLSVVPVCALTCTDGTDLWSQHRETEAGGRGIRADAKESNGVYAITLRRSNRFARKTLNHTE